MSRGKPINTERLVVAWDREWEWGTATNWQEGFLRGDHGVLKFDCGDGCTTQLKHTNFRVCKLHYKTVIKKEGTAHV